MEGGIGGLLGGIFMRGNKSNFLRQSALPLSLLYFRHPSIMVMKKFAALVETPPDCATAAVKSGSDDV